MTPEASPPASNPPAYNVLLIEADAKQTELYTELLKEVADCQVDVTESGERAFDLVGRSNYQLVVIDSAAMPSGSDCLDLLERIRRISPVTSVILISEEASVEQAVAAIRLGAEDYLKKPFNLEAFQLAVKRGLDKKAVFGGNTGAAQYLNLLNSCQIISSSLEQSKIFGVVKSYFQRELHSAFSAIYTVAGADSRRVADVPAQGHSQERAPERAPDRAMEEILDIAIQASNPLPKMAEADEMYRFMERGQLTPGLFFFRFRCAGPQDYFCVCLSPERPESIEAFESRLRMLKTQIELTGKNISQYQGVQSLAYVDDATGLYNTRYLHYILDREIVQANSTQKSFAVLFIDADKFKGVNDAHGHLAGTKLLNELGSQLKSYVRDSDTVFRYGGDEFVAVLSPCDLHTASTVAERIRHSVETTAFLKDESLNLHVTVSIGVALFPDHADSKQAIIEKADHAMYQAKRTTRNSVFISPSAPSPELQAGAVPIPLKTESPDGRGSNSGSGSKR